MQNNILHKIAEKGIYEFYAILKRNKNFENLKNMKNSDNMTPRDIARIKPVTFKNIMSLASLDDMIMTPIMVTAKYYGLSATKLIREMKNDNLMRTNSIKYNTIKYFSKYKEKPIVKSFLENMENIKEDEFEKEIETEENMEEDEFEKQIEKIMKKEEIKEEKKYYNNPIYYFFALPIIAFALHYIFQIWQ
jgi:hypothetical protein